MKKKKGFTLVELIMVIAIIGILLAVLVPTWSYFIMKANLKTQNNYSKVIFNAAQTQVTRLENREKKDYTTVLTSPAASTEAKDAKSRLFLASSIDDTKSFSFYLYWDGKKATQVGSDGAAVSDPNPNQQLVDEFAAAINKVFGESSTTVYKVFVQDYKVMSVCSARSDGSETIGAYPNMRDGRTNNGAVSTFNMSSIVKS